jgi:hypothetical protein
MQQQYQQQQMQHQYQYQQHPLTSEDVRRCHKAIFDWMGSLNDFEDPDQKRIVQHITVRDYLAFFDIDEREASQLHAAFGDVVDVDEPIELQTEITRQILQTIIDHDMGIVRELWLWPRL